MIHTTIGIYPDGSFKTNGVTSENLPYHIWYNMTFRPGRTLYVDGILIYRGLGFSDELADLWGNNAKEGNSGKALEFKVNNDTAPYH